MRLRDTDTGAGLVEFALLMALIALVAFVAVQFAGSEASGLWSDIGSSLDSANAAS